MEKQKEDWYIGEVGLCYQDVCPYAAELCCSFEKSKYLDMPVSNEQSLCCSFLLGIPPVKARTGHPFPIGPYR